MRHVYEVGDKIIHEGFGEGLVVDVRRRPFYDILEVAFGDGVRKITSIHPQIRPEDENGGDAPLAAPRQKRTPKSSAEPADGISANGIAPNPPMGPPATTDDVDPEAASPAHVFEDEDVVRLDQRSLAILDQPSYDADPTDYALRLVAEHLGLNRGFERLISLESIRGIQRYQYQVRACLKVLREMNGRALLADEVGLGKTIEAGIILKEYVLRGLVRRCLLLVPVSLVTQWQEEMYQKFDLEFAAYGKDTDWDEDFLIASLDTAKTLRNREVVLGHDYDMVIVDEAHRLRNHQTLGWKFIDALSVKHILLLTATPVQNDLRELFNLVTLLKPGALGTYREFRRGFMVRGDKRLPKNTRELGRLLGKVMIRTTRSSTAIKFPSRHVETVTFELTPIERALYDGVSEFIRRMTRTGDEKLYQKWHFILMVLQKEIGSSSFAARGTLRKVLTDHHTAEESGDLQHLVDLADQIEHNTKLVGLDRVLGEREGEKVIVFTQFLETLAYLERSMAARGIRTSVFHGGLSATEKELAIDRFRRHAQVLISTEAGGEGRNLQFCRTIVNYDLPWNPMRVEQRIGRIHRLGQKRDIYIYNFTTENTVETYVLELLIKKIRMFELVIGEMDMILGSLEEQGAFENRVFQIWSSARDQRELRTRFEEYGEELVGARRRYEKVKDLDADVFDDQ
jgi:SNF2 family DNA or RNA helicase